MATYNLSDEKKEAIFDQITKLYDLADNVANSIGLDGVQNRPQQFDIAKPFILQLYASADKISEIYTSCVQADTPITPQQKSEMESAFAGIFQSLKVLSDTAEQLPRN